MKTGQFLSQADSSERYLVRRQRIRHAPSGSIAAVRPTQRDRCFFFTRFSCNASAAQRIGSPRPSLRLRPLIHHAARAHARLGCCPIKGHSHNTGAVACRSGQSPIQPVTLQSESDAQPWKFLKDFSKQQFRGLAADLLATREQRDVLRKALLAAYAKPNMECGWNPDASEPDVMIGIVASDVRLAVRGLRDWCEALQLEYVVPEVRVAGATGIADIRGNVYVKLNAKSKTCYVSAYQGRDSNGRGVLLQLAQEQLGFFPLGIWDEEKLKPPPDMA